MSAKFTSKIRNLIADSLINIANPQSNLWESSNAYLEGETVYYGSNRYICKGSGTSGHIPPTHVNGTATDGGVNWIWVESNSLNTSFNKNIFIGIGKITEWDDENSPDEVGITDINDYDTFNNIVALKKLSSGNFRLAIKRYDWTAGTVYSAYHHSKDPSAISGDTSYDHPFYVFTNNNNIYKCLDNNNGAQSMNSPTGTGTNVTVLADGYVWKYMGSFNPNSVEFLTDSYIPVNRVISDDGSNQWLVQEAAKKYSISAFSILESVGTFPDGGVVNIVGCIPTTPAQAYAVTDDNDLLTQVIVNSPGVGYDVTARVEAIVKQDGASGTGATISAITRSGNSIQSLTIGNAGSGYTDGAICILIDPDRTSGTDAVLTVNVSGNNTISEVHVDSGGTGYTSSVRAYIVPGTAGAITSAVFAPKEGHGSNIITELNASNVLISVRLAEYEDYLLTGDDNAFRQISLVTDVKVYGTNNYAYDLMYIGPSHPDYDENSLNRIVKDEGYVLYVNNIKKVVRSSGQEEELKISISL